MNSRHIAQQPQTSPKRIFCIEGLWDDNLRRKITVLPILELLESTDNVQFIHHKVATEHELEFFINAWKRARYKTYPILYLAFHGEPGRLLLGKKSYTLQRLAKTVSDTNGQLILFLASCSILKIPLIDLQNFFEMTNAQMIVGYCKDVPWNEACAFELLVLSLLQELQFNSKSLNRIQTKIQNLAVRFPDLRFHCLTKSTLKSSIKL